MIFGWDRNNAISGYYQWREMSRNVVMPRRQHVGEAPKKMKSHPRLMVVLIVHRYTGEGL